MCDDDFCVIFTTAQLKQLIIDISSLLLLLLLLFHVFDLRPLTMRRDTNIFKLVGEAQ